MASLGVGLDRERAAVTWLRFVTRKRRRRKEEGVTLRNRFEGRLGELGKCENRPLKETRRGETEE